jgi:NAD-dependent dihydropyrimidine dehydrogenase PreA subunit
LDGDIFIAQINGLKDLGVNFMINTKLSKDLILKDIKDELYGAVFLATGFGSSPPDQIKDNKKTVIIDPLTLETKVKGVFAGGSLLAERLSLVRTIASAKRAAISIDRYLRRMDLKADREIEVNTMKRMPREGIKQKPRLQQQDGFDHRMAFEEAGRCMSCGSLAQIAHPEDCMTCFECELECPSNAIKVHPFKEVLPMTLAIK